MSRILSHDEFMKLDLDQMIEAIDSLVKDIRDELKSAVRAEKWTCPACEQTFDKPQMHRQFITDVQGEWCGGYDPETISKKEAMIMMTGGDIKQRNDAEDP